MVEMDIGDTDEIRHRMSKLLQTTIIVNKEDFSK